LPPSIVNVFPVPVCPYASTVLFRPWSSEVVVSAQHHVAHLIIDSNNPIPNSAPTMLQSVDEIPVALTQAV
jgi:hypothetical protein